MGFKVFEQNFLLILKETPEYFRLKYSLVSVELFLPMNFQAIANINFSTKC